MEKCFEFCSFWFDSKKDYSELCSKVLSENELEKIKSCVQKRKNEFIFGRLCAKKCYSKLSKKEFNPTSTEILNKKTGAPFLLDGKFGVSISHDAKIAAAIVFNKSEIITAIDVQKISAENSEVIYKFVNDSEKAIIDDSTKNLGFDFSCGTVWAAKEAISKMFGFGFSIFNVLQISKICSFENRSDVCVEFENLKAFSVVIRKYSNYIFAFASSKKDSSNFFEENLPIKIEKET